MRPHISIRGCVRWSVCPAVHPSVPPFFSNMEKKQKMNKELNKSMKKSEDASIGCRSHLLVEVFRPLIIFPISVNDCHVISSFLRQDGHFFPFLGLKFTLFYLYLKKKLSYRGGIGSK